MHRRGGVLTTITITITIIVILIAVFHWVKMISSSEGQTHVHEEDDTPHDLCEDKNAEVWLKESPPLREISRHLKGNYSPPQPIVKGTLCGDWWDYRHKLERLRVCHRGEPRLGKYTMLLLLLLLLSWGNTKRNRYGDGDRVHVGICCGRVIIVITS
jgi:hypothetical protein